MSIIPKRIISYKEHRITILSIQDKFGTYTSYVDIWNQFQKYIDIMKPYYHDVCESAFLARTAYSFKSVSDYNNDYAQDNENVKLICEMVNDTQNTYNEDGKEINVNLLRHMVNHAFELLVDFLKTIDSKYPSFADFWKYAWTKIITDIDIAFSASNTDQGVTYKINIPYKSQEKVIWRKWSTVKINKNLDPEDIRCINTGRDQSIDRISQHLETSRLRIIDNKIQIIIYVKRETPEAYKNNMVMSIDKGLNHFLAYHCESIDGVRTQIDHCISSSLRKEYYKAIDSGNKQRIFKAKYEILKYAVDDMIDKIRNYNPRFLIIENMVGSFADTDDKYVRAFPWVDYQKIIRRKASEAGVHVIMVYDNETSRDYAMGDDVIVRNKHNRSIGYCKKSGEVVNCDKNASLNIWGRGVVKVLEYYVLTKEQMEEIKRFVKSRGRTLATVNYSTAKDVIEYCRIHFGVCIF